MHKNACFLLATANRTGKDVLFSGRLNRVSRSARYQYLDCRIQLVSRRGVVLAAMHEVIHSTFSTSQPALTSASIVVSTSNAAGRASGIVT